MAASVIRYKGYTARSGTTYKYIKITDGIPNTYMHCEDTFGIHNIIMSDYAHLVCVCVTVFYIDLGLGYCSEQVGLLALAAPSVLLWGIFATKYILR